MTHDEVLQSFERQVGYMRNQLLNGNYKGFISSVQLLKISMETRVGQIGEERNEENNGDV